MPTHLCPALVSRVHRLADAGHNQQSIARKLKISQGSVSHLLASRAARIDVDALPRTRPSRESSNPMEGCRTLIEPSAGEPVVVSPEQRRRMVRGWLREWKEDYRAWRGGVHATAGHDPGLGPRREVTDVR